MEFPTIDEVESFVREGVAEGYGNPDVSKHKVDVLPGAKLIYYRRESFRLVDQYYTAPESQRSGGMTVATYNGVPVWMMQYGGWYPGYLIPFLKRSLQAGAIRTDFFGFRGPKVFTGGEYRYENHLRQGHFDNFEGEEYIVPKDAPPIGSPTHVLGHHWYRGMSLLPGTTSVLF